MTFSPSSRTDRPEGMTAPESVLSYRLTPEDARAWERRDPAQRKRNRAALGVSGMVGISLLVTVTRHLPDWLSQLHSNAIAVAILLLPGLGVLLSQRRDLNRRVRDRVPEAVDVTLEVWPRRLAEIRADGRAPLVLGAESLREVIETDSHIFLHARAGTIILPASAFADAKAKDAFAGYWEEFVH